MNRITNLEGKVAWQKIIAAYARPDLPRSIWQIINTLIPFFALFYLSIRSVDVSFWLTLPLTVLTVGFMIRAFIIFHDCGHGSFFKSQRANDVLGFVTGLLAFTPYYRWKHAHAFHHATSGDLDRRGMGDVYTMTVQEYLDAPWWKKTDLSCQAVDPALQFEVPEMACLRRSQPQAGSLGSIEAIPAETCDGLSNRLLRFAGVYDYNGEYGS